MYGGRKKQMGDVPKPLIFELGGRGTFPVSLASHLLVSPVRLGTGERIPQVSMIMLPVVENVHGAGLKRSELI